MDEGTCIRRNWGKSVPGRRNNKDKCQKVDLSVTTSVKSFWVPCHLHYISGLHLFSACVSSLFIIFSYPPEPPKTALQDIFTFLEPMPSVSCLSSWTQNWFILLKKTILLGHLVQRLGLWRSSLSYSQHCLEGTFLHCSFQKKKKVLPIYVVWIPGQRQGWVPQVGSLNYTQNCHALFSFPLITDQ